MAAWRTGGEHRSAALLDHLAHLIRINSESALEPLGLRPRHLVALTLLRDNPGTGQQDLTAMLQVERTNVVGLLNDLEQQQLISRTRHVADRRRHVVELTPAGRERLEQAEAAMADAESGVLAGLNSKEQEELFQLLRRASRNHSITCTGAMTGTDHSLDQ